jgi:hypothetical protein
MSALIFHFSEEEIILAMDTLATTPDGMPLLFSTKFQVLPHMRAVICGTGIGGIADRWALAVNTRMRALDVLHLDTHTPEGLREIAAACAKEYGDLKQTTTVYQLGFPADGSPPIGFAYRSYNNFESEPLTRNAVHLKPEADVPPGTTLPADFSRIMFAQRAEQETRPKERRIYIGGDILVCHMASHATQIYS